MCVTPRAICALNKSPYYLYKTYCLQIARSHKNSEYFLLFQHHNSLKPLANIENNLSKWEIFTGLNRGHVDLKLKTVSQTDDKRQMNICLVCKLCAPYSMCLCLCLCVSAVYSSFFFIFSFILADMNMYFNFIYNTKWVLLLLFLFSAIDLVLFSFLLLVCCVDFNPIEHNGLRCACLISKILSFKL